jgi:hypothetical protein
MIIKNFFVDFVQKNCLFYKINIYLSKRIFLIKLLKREAYPL